jgi:hypothetical protein
MMKKLQALIQGNVTAEEISLDELLHLAEKYTDETSSEYKLLELATNLVLAYYLEKANHYV